jgi:CO dehydrogenase/acetyl-CoA synthase delta subunit
VLLTAGADVLVMRHPEAIKLIKEMIAELAV